MTKRKWLTVTLLVCMALSTACAANTEKPGAVAAPPTASSSAAATPTSEGTKPALKVLQINQPEDYNTYPVAKVLEEKTGYKVQYDMLPVDKPQDKLNLIVSSSEPYDVITTLGGVDFQALYTDYARKGALTDLTPLIDKFGPNIKAQISQASLDAMKVDGKIYAIPTKAVSFVGGSILIRQDWLDKLGLKVPTTTDELVNVLKQFKDKDLGGNGDKNIPMTINGTLPFIDSIAGAFGIPNSWNERDGKLVPRILDPAYKDYVAFVSDLFKQGLLDKEFATNNDASVKEKLTSGRAGVVPVTWGDVPAVTDALNKNQPNAKLVYIGALKGKDGKSGFPTNAGMDRLSFIPKSSKHPEDAIKWMNTKLDKDVFKLMAIGQEGVHYTFKDGAYSPILPIFNDERNRANNYLSGIDEANYPVYWQARVRKDMRLFSGWESLNTKQPAEVKFTDPVGAAPYMPNFAKNNLQLNSMVNDYTIKLIFGSEQLTGLDAFQQKYKAAGGDASIKEVNDWYAALKK